MGEDDCIFCAIVGGEIPSRTVGENEAAVAFLDVNPLAPGHTLVVPRDHHSTIADAPTEDLAELFALLVELTPLVEDAVDADASTVGINNGEAAGQEIPHLHAHIVPRFVGDGGGPIHAVAGDRPVLSDEELDEIASAIAG